MRALMLALALQAASPVEAAACHRFSHWRYPWAQSCGMARHLTFIPTERAHEELPPVPDIPLPGLARADLDGGEADEASRRSLLLRAAVGDPDGR
jgi:hypothetical protein